jgi:ferredoxin
MKIVVDYDLCEANAICQRVAPELFRVDDKDVLQVLQPEPPEALRDKLEAAVRRCPRRALTLID